MKIEVSALGVMEPHVLDFHRKLSLFPTLLTAIPSGHESVRIPGGLARGVQPLALIQSLKSDRRPQLASGLKQLQGFEKYLTSCHEKMRRGVYSATAVMIT